ncbi:hypothetical protein HJ01_00935 [Flavobacterium frigoris PS1]|uniref:Uncharacterized protein n=1 Tax=Flavobacterium frigoris (strain PS1) TaxID=1086011 RepID=H7FP38_FLAFP|nr:hypothetical protein HJ01_00935 [Flavobacterium frigoris PS1]
MPNKNTAINERKFFIIKTFTKVIKNIGFLGNNSHSISGTVLLRSNLVYRNESGGGKSKIYQISKVKAIWWSALQSSKANRNQL